MFEIADCSTLDHSTDDNRESAHHVESQTQSLSTHRKTKIELELDPCQIPVCGDEADLQCAVDLVAATLCQAVSIVESDPRNIFVYKFPKLLRCPSSYEVNATSFQFIVSGDKLTETIFKNTTEVTSFDSTVANNWSTIGNFQYDNVRGEIRNYISKWQLTPGVKCVVLSNYERQDLDVRGSIYFADAHFSRPTPRCPNPLAVAKVRFIITVSKIMPKCYPVMVAYRFEGYKTLYYALGDRALNSVSFQRFYIDTILHTKLAFYAEICECRHGTVENPKRNVQPTKQKKRDIQTKNQREN